MRCRVCGFDLDGRTCIRCEYYQARKERAEEEGFHWRFRDLSQELKERW